MKLQPEFPLTNYLGCGLDDIKLMTCHIAYVVRTDRSCSPWLIRAAGGEGGELAFLCVDEEEAKRAIALTRPAECAEAPYVAPILALADYETKLAIPLVGHGVRTVRPAKKSMREAKPVPLLLRGELDEAVREGRLVWYETTPI